MTAYPINYSYDKRYGSMFDGFAADAEQARAMNAEILTEANGETTESPIMQLQKIEAGMVAKTRDQIEEWWAEEIAAGWATPTKGWGGWIAEVTYWTADQ